MIRRIQVSNFRSLGEDVSIELGLLTVLVGVNASGKSNVADVLQFVADCLRDGLEVAVARRHGFAGIARSEGGRMRDVSIRIEVEGGDGHEAWEFALRSADNEFGYAVFHKEGTLSRPLTDELEKIAIYKIFPNRLREAQRPDFTHPMREHGENWASVFRRLPRETTGLELLAALGRITGDIDDYRVSSVGGYLIPEFRHTSPDGTSSWRGAVQESDGTLRVAGILTALLQEPPLTLIGIEEPEQTIHPGALGILLDYIREASQRGQVLLTTHSSDLLDLLNIDEIRVVEREGGTTTVSAVEESQRILVEKRLASPSEIVFSDGRLHGQSKKAAHG